MQDEAGLIKRAQQRDHEALTQIYEENFDRIYRYIVMKIGERTEAEDITQQVFVKALKSVSSFSYKGTPFSAWLFRIAHNMIVDYLRQKTKKGTLPLKDTIVSKTDDPVKTAEMNLSIEELAAAARHLTPSQQEVISLRFSADLSIAEIARMMGKSEGAVKALQHSAVVSLRKILNVTAECHEARI
ncbi:MAG: sigma-70 family RNA polymerase sigma factor [Chloroflexi bacterium]|nr:sigma-70 family RNA polymerase sigma factor [Chloroflexota bacterium]